MLPCTLMLNIDFISSLWYWEKRFTRTFKGQFFCVMEMVVFSFLHTPHSSAQEHRTPHGSSASHGGSFRCLAQEAGATKGEKRPIIKYPVNENPKLCSSDHKMVAICFLLLSLLHFATGSPAPVIKIIVITSCISVIKIFACTTLI